MPPERYNIDLNALVTVGQAAQFLGMPKQRVNRWYQLGRLKEAATRSDGTRLYRIGDVLEAERATRNSPFSSRSKVRFLPPPDAYHKVA